MSIVSECHGLTSTDGLVMTGEGAWHGLGVVVEDAPSPREALRITGMDWTTELWPMLARQPGKLPPDVKREEILTGDDNGGDCYMTVRSDTHERLGIVKGRYSPCHNRELADFCETLAKKEFGGVDGGVKVESSGSILGGKKVWWLLRAESILLNQGKDEVKPYFQVSSSHDGSSEIEMTSTSIRTVCRNTLRLSLETKGNWSTAVTSVRHSGDMEQKLRAARVAIQQFGKALADSTLAMHSMVERDMSEGEVRAFFMAAYQRDFGKLALDPKTELEAKHKAAAMEAALCMERRFKQERYLSGQNLWNALNAYTGYIQNDLKYRGKNAQMREERRTAAKLFGSAVDRTDAAWQQAMSVLAG